MNSLLGKTLKIVDTSSCNMIEVELEDGSRKQIFAECGSSSTSIPYFELYEEDDDTDE